MQTSYNMYNGLAKLGQLLEPFAPRVVSAKIARGICRAGVGLFRIPTVGGAGSSFSDPGESYQNPVPAAAASATAILASGGASSLSQQVVSGAAFNGTAGFSSSSNSMIEMQPARKVTLVLSNHANWSATTAVLRGYNHNGQLVSENLSIPSSGNTTLTSANFYRSLLDLTIPAQGGTSGTFTVGVAILDGTVDINDFQGVCVYQPVHMPAASVNLLGGVSESSPWGVAGANSGSTAIGAFGDNDTLDCLESGAIVVLTEVATVDGDPVYVRVGAGSGGSTLGAFRNDSDSSTAVQVVGAKFIRAGASGLGFARFK